jgi:hypothetical protein
MSGDVNQIGVNNLFWTGTVLWVVLWAMFVSRLAWLDARLRAHLTEHHPHRCGGCRGASGSPGPFGSSSSLKEDYGDPAIGARRREMLTVFFDMLLVLAAMIVWFVVSAAIAEVGP